MEAKLRSRHIIYVDDDPDDRLFFSSALEGLDVRLDVFESANAFLDCPEFSEMCHDASLIFIDLNMPGISGFELLKILKVHPLLRDTPVAVITTSSSSVCREKCRHLGASYFLTKECTLPGLRKSLLSVIANKA